MQTPEQIAAGLAAFADTIARQMGVRFTVCPKRLGIYLGHQRAVLQRDANPDNGPEDKLP